MKYTDCPQCGFDEGYRKGTPCPFCKYHRGRPKKVDTLLKWMIPNKYRIKRGATSDSVGSAGSNPIISAKVYVKRHANGAVSIAWGMVNKWP
jgi:hypothetical protein